MTDKFKALSKAVEIIEAHVPLESAAGEPGDAGCSCGEPLGRYTWHGYCIHLAEALLDQQAPAGELPRKGLLELRQPDEMIAWLNELNSNWAVCRNTRSFKEGQPSEYWKKFDEAMGAAFELQIALMKLAAGRSSQPVAGTRFATRGDMSSPGNGETAQIINGQWVPGAPDAPQEAMAKPRDPAGK